MSDRYEIDGIIYFKEPLSIRYTDWIYNHLDCDAIITEESSHTNIVSIICFAKSEEYNLQLRKIRNTKYPHDIIMQGVSSEEVLSLC